MIKILGKLKEMDYDILRRLFDIAFELRYFVTFYMCIHRDSTYLHSYKKLFHITYKTSQYEEKDILSLVANSHLSRIGCCMRLFYVYIILFYMFRFGNATSFSWTFNPLQLGFVSDLLIKAVIHWLFITLQFCDVKTCP